MGNLIIKGKGGAGNKLILQDQAGAAVLTTADSGATIVNATLNSPTLVTPALGTPASGVLTNATFPAGHVIQTVTATYNTENSDTTTSSTLIKAVQGGTNHWTAQITNVLASSKVLVQAIFTFELASTGIDPGCAFGFFREASQIFPPSSGFATNAFYFCPRSDHSGGNTQTRFWNGVPYMAFLDESPGTGTNNYYLGYSCGHDTVKISKQCPFTMILQEIQT